MLEQQLINAFMKLTAKVGAGDIVRSIVQNTDENGNPKTWSSKEMDQAIAFIQAKTDAFGKDDALKVIRTLMKKYQIDSQEIVPSHDEVVPDHPGIKGLQ